jgi:hypothetical protein
MGPFSVVPFNSVSNGVAGCGEAGEVLLAYTVFFEIAKKAFNEAVLFATVGCDELRAAGGNRSEERENAGFEKSAHMTRRDFIEAGIGGVAPLALFQVSFAQSPPISSRRPPGGEDTAADLSVVVVGVDAADLTAIYIDDYLSVGTTCGNTPRIP